MTDPPDEPVAECLRCRELEARLLELETRLRDLEDRLKGPATERPVESRPPAPGKTPTGKMRGAQRGTTRTSKNGFPASG